MKNKVMAQNEFTVLLPTEKPIYTSKRNRIPSKYAQSIQELTKTKERKTLKKKQSNTRQTMSSSKISSSTDDQEGIDCLLPGCVKKIRLSILIKKPQKRKQVKTRSCQNIPPPIKTQSAKNPSLLDTFLQVCINLEADETNNKTTNPFSLEEQKKESQKNLSGTKIRQSKEENQKYFKFYNKYQQLNQKLDEFWNQPYTI